MERGCFSSRTALLVFLTALKAPSIWVCRWNSGLPHRIEKTQKAWRSSPSNRSAWHTHWGFSAAGKENIRRTSESQKNSPAHRYPPIGWKTEFKLEGINNILPSLELEILEIQPRFLLEGKAGKFVKNNRSSHPYFYSYIEEPFE